MFGKIFCRKNACDVIRSVRSYPAEYYFAAEQAYGYVSVHFDKAYDVKIKSSIKFVLKIKFVIDQIFFFNI